MNICFYTDYTLSGMTGGIGRATTVLTDYFRQHYGWKVYSIYAFEAAPECTLTENDGAIRLRLHDRMGIRRGLLANYPKAAQFIGEKQIDVMVIQTSMDVVAKLRKALHDQGLDRVKVISVLHYTPGTDEFPIDASKFWKGLAQGKFSAKDCAKSLVAPLFNAWEHHATVQAYRQAYEHGDRVMLLSQSYIPMYQRFADLKDTNRLLAIPNCVPFEYTMTEAEMQQKQKTCLMVGRMVDYPKRVSLVLKMWQAIEQRPEANDWNLEIVGDGPDLPTFRSQAQALGLSRCTFTGRQNPIEYYRHASLFFMTSEFEGFPMTLVEAQQMGCLPVAFDSFGSLHEVVEDGTNGSIVPEGHVEEYVQTILGLMQHEDDRQRMAHNALMSCRAYSQEAVCQQWKDFLTHLAQ